VLGYEPFFIPLGWNTYILAFSQRKRLSLFFLFRPIFRISIFLNLASKVWLFCLSFFRVDSEKAVYQKLLDLGLVSKEEDRKKHSSSTKLMLCAEPPIVEETACFPKRS
jgi:hypothetical protein